MRHIGSTRRPSNERTVSICAESVYGNARAALGLHPAGSQRAGGVENRSESGDPAQSVKRSRAGEF